MSSQVFLLLLLASGALAIDQELAYDVPEPSSPPLDKIDSSYYAYGTVESNEENLDANQHKKCEPVFDLSSYLTSSKLTHATDQVSPPGQRRFSFEIGKVDMPLTPPNGSIKTVLQVLSSFGKYGLDIGLPFSSSETEAEETPTNLIQFRSNKLHIQGLNMTMLNVHLFGSSQPKFAIGVAVKNTTLTGRFTYHGPRLFYSSEPISAYYRMSIADIMLVASSNLTKSIGNLGPKLLTNDLRMNITNLGYVDIDILDSPESTSSTSDSMLQMVRRLLLMTVKTTYHTFESRIRDVLQRESRRALDCELTKLSPLIDKSSPSIGQNDLAKIMRIGIEQSNFSSVPLPNYEHKQSVLGSTAVINFFNGSLHGLNNVNLDGETRIKLQDKHLYVNTSVVWSDLKPYYNWNLTFGNARSPVSKGFVSFDIKTIDFDTVITRGLDGRPRFVVERLVIEKLENPRMDIGGFPGVNRVTRGVVNFLMGRLRQRVVGSILPVLKSRLEMSLNKAASIQGLESS